jgi:hypothetical protein
MTNEEIKALVDEFNRKVSLDPEISSVMEKIRNQEADFSDTSRMFWRRSELLRNYLQGVVLDLPAGAREQLCTALLNAGYNETNEVMQSVQQAQDEPQGIHLNPVLPKRPADRIHTVAHALEDPTVSDDKIVRRAGAPVANVQMSFHDRYIEENAKIRAKLGMKPTITRYGSGCCAWCSAVAGRYRFGDQPKDIFRRHDNCGCTIIYDNQVLRGRETSSGRSKTWEEVDPKSVEALGFTPTVHTQEQAAELQEQLMQGVHAIKGKKRSKFEPSVRMDTIIGGKPIEESFQKELSDEFDKFISIFGSMDNVRSVTAYPYQNDGIWGAYNDNSYELFLFGSGGEEGRTLLSKTAKQMRKDGKWSTSSVYHTFRHELGHALQERLKRTDPNYAQKIQEIEKIQKTILDSLTSLEESDKIKSMKSTLSEYGIRDEIDEFISECIAEYCDGKPRTTAKSVVDILLKGGEQNVS